MAFGMCFKTHAKVSVPDLDGAILAACCNELSITAVGAAYGDDLLPLVGLQHPDPTTLITMVLQGKLWPTFLRLAIAHVKDGYVVPLPHGNATVAGDGVVSTAAIPLASMDLKLPSKASVQDKSASLVVLVTPAHGRFMSGHK